MGGRAGSGWIEASVLLWMLGGAACTPPDEDDGATSPTLEATDTQSLDTLQPEGTDPASTAGPTEVPPTEPEATEEPGVTESPEDTDIGGGTHTPVEESPGDVSPSDEPQGTAVPPDTEVPPPPTDEPPPVDNYVGECAAYFNNIGTYFTGVKFSDLSNCTGVEAAQHITDSLMNMDGIIIDNDGDDMIPCVEAMCDDDYVYVATNTLPHYDFVATTPNVLKENIFVYRLPIVPVPVGSQSSFDTVQTLQDTSNATAGCQDAFDGYVSGSATSREPSELCMAEETDKAYLYDNTSGNYYHKIPCLNTMAMVISGVPIFGPNEAQTPDPWGNPFFSVPDEAGDWDGKTSMLDLCLGHTADAMHYHGLNEGCFELDENNAPANTYAETASQWSVEAALNETCTTPSGIVGWNLDGYPIMGPCVCTKRSGTGTCIEVKRARSSWVYRGLKAWGTTQEVNNSLLSNELKSCTRDSDCCSGNNCNFFCESVPIAGNGGTIQVAERCVQSDYSWCSHGFQDMTDIVDNSFAYLDICNGYQGPDGYAYYATASFPYVPACYHGQPVESYGAGGGTGGDPGEGGGNPPACNAVPQGQPCCGDGVCGGPETTQNCSADCH